MSSTEVETLVLKFKKYRSEALFNDLYNCFAGLIIVYGLKLYKKIKTLDEDLEDCIQIMWLVFLRAVETYDAVNQDSLFQGYLVCCLEREVKNHYRILFRKNRVENYCMISLDSKPYEEANYSYLDIIESDAMLPNNKYELNETLDLYENTPLNKVYREIFNLYLFGFSYKEISTLKKLPTKSIDNIISATKRKIRSR